MGIDLLQQESDSALIATMRTLGGKAHNASAPCSTPGVHVAIQRWAA